MNEVQKRIAIMDYGYNDNNLKSVEEFMECVIDGLDANELSLGYAKALVKLYLHSHYGKLGKEK